MPRTAADQTITRAYSAVARLEKARGVLTDLCTLISPTLPIVEAEDHLDNVDDHLDALRAKLTDALAAMTRHIEAREAA